MLLPSATKLQRLCFYTCLSFCSQGGASASVHARIPPPGPGTPLGADTPPRSRPPRTRTPPPRETATVADGLHPTGMHTCLDVVSVVCLLQGCSRGAIAIAFNASQLMGWMEFNVIVAITPCVCLHYYNVEPICYDDKNHNRNQTV